MKLKTTNHYTYFIYPFLVDSTKYGEFLSKLLADETNWMVNIRDNSVDLSTHAYFLPYVKKILFPTLYWSNTFRDQFTGMPLSKRAEILKNLTSISFDYRLDENCGEDCRFSATDINFGIRRIELICFEPGVCFLILKAHLDKAEVFTDDILDFNYKFRTINPRYQKKKKVEGIFLKNLRFENLEDFSVFIDSLLYGFEDVDKENIYFDRLFTYSYMCLDEREWNEDRHLNGIIDEFYKFQYVLPSDYGSTFDPSFMAVKGNTYARWKYSIYGMSREAGVLLSSEREKSNSVKLPKYFETIYFYVFLLAFYQRITLILFSDELMSRGHVKIETLKNRFTRFTHFSWFSQITNSEQGMDLWKKWQTAFDLPALFDEVQKEYDEFYNFIVAKGQEKINLMLIVIYMVSVFFAGVPLLVSFQIINSDNLWARYGIVLMLILTAAIYPAYLLYIWLKKRLTKQPHEYGQNNKSNKR